MDQSDNPTERESEPELPNKSVVPISLVTIKAACSQCSLHELCLPLEASSEDGGRSSTAWSGTRRKLKRQQNLYRAGDPFEAIYAMRTGFFKTDVLLEDGRDQVTGFQMAGESSAWTASAPSSIPATRWRWRTARSA
jgi:CRP-like cAMP-binding protein